MRRAATLLGLLVLTTACSSNPYLEHTLKPAAQRHETKEWFQKEWGQPDGRSSRMWGGELWTYYRIAGGTRRFLAGINPHDCEIKLYFDKQDQLDDYSYSGCSP
jgi:hypothetical protein